MSVIFLDNAATTPLEPRVKDEMIRMMENFGNPSSTHLSGRSAKVEVEIVRKRIAKAIGALPSEIFFTSGVQKRITWHCFAALEIWGLNE